MTKAEITIVDVPLEEIQPYWRNPRKNDNTIPALAKSIERYGFNVPLVLDKKKVIVTGHARYRALKKLGWATAPCVITEIDQKALREFRVMDNRVQELTQWDEEALAKELKRIFDGTQLADFFAGSLDRVLDMDELTGDAVDIDFSAMDESHDIAGVTDKEVDDYVCKCPYCETPLTVDNIVEEANGDT